MILLTGGTGFLGGHLLVALLKKHESVKVIHRKSIEKCKQQLLPVFNFYTDEPEAIFNKIQWVEADVLDIHSLMDALEGVTHVYHCAAIVSFNKSDKEHMMRTNVEGTANVVNACLKQGIQKLCHVSSIAALGRVQHNELNTEASLWKNSPLNSSYSISKYHSEQEVWRGIEEGLQAVMVNPSVILGPNQWQLGTAKLFELVWKGLKFYTKGSNGYVDVRDVAKAMIQLMESDISAERYIISSENLNYHKLFNLMALHLHKKPPQIEAGAFLSKLAVIASSLYSLLSGKAPFITKETASTAQRAYQYSNDKIRNAINFTFIPIEETIRETSEYFLKTYQ